MIRIRHMILKENLFDWVSNPKVSKVVLDREQNSKLKKDDLCKIFVFHYVKIEEINTIFGSCKVIIKENKNESFLDGKDHAFLNGIMSQKLYGFLSKSMITKLIGIEEKYDVNLSISKNIRELIKKY